MTDGEDDLLGGLAFHDVAARAGAKGAFGIKLLVVHGQHDDGEAGLEDLEALDELDAGTFLERDVHDGHVGLVRGDALHGAGRILRLAADDEVGLLVDQVGQPFAHQRMVVHEKDLNF